MTNDDKRPLPIAVDDTTPLWEEPSKKSRRWSLPLPRIPFFRDEKAFGAYGPKLATTMRVFIAAILLAFITMGVCLIIVINIANGIHEDQVRGHASRLTDQARQQKQIVQNQALTRDLACSVVFYFLRLPVDQRPPQGFLQYLSDRYQCVNYHPPVSILPPVKSSGHSTTTPKATPTRRSAGAIVGPQGPTSVPSPSAGSTRAAGGGQATRRAATAAARTAPARPAPGKTVTKVHTQTKTKTAPAPKPSSSPRGVVCTIELALLGSCIL